MIRYDNDLKFIKAVGLAIAALGVMLLLLSITIGALALLRVTPAGFGTFTYTTIAQGVLALIMSFSMVACGAELAHPDQLLASGREALRLNPDFAQARAGLALVVTAQNKVNAANTTDRNLR